MCMTMSYVYFIEIFFVQIKGCNDFNCTGVKYVFTLK